MSEARFPRRLSDGSFCVDIVIDGATDPALVRDWIVNDWMPANSIWERHWSSGNKEVLQYSKEFATAPEVHSIDGGKFLVRLRGASSSTALWKDWYAKLCGDLTTRWPDSKVLEAVNSPYG